MPTVAPGTRGTFHFDLVVALRPGGVHSGHWGGLTTDPALVLSHALGTIVDRNGRIAVRDGERRALVPGDGFPELLAAGLGNGVVARATLRRRLAPVGGDPPLPLEPLDLRLARQIEGLERR